MNKDKMDNPTERENLNEYLTKENIKIATKYFNLFICLSLGK